MPRIFHNIKIKTSDSLIKIFNNCFYINKKIVYLERQLGKKLIWTNNNPLSLERGILARN